MNGLQSITQWQDYFGSPSGSVLRVVNTAQSIGSVISLPVIGILPDCIGRRLTLLSGAIVIIVASIIQAAPVRPRQESRLSRFDSTRNRQDSGSGSRFSEPRFDFKIFRVEPQVPQTVQPEVNT
jgi:hypothetical protein